MAKIISIFHIAIIIGNTIAIPMLMLYQPFYIWLPIVTYLCSPMIGGVYCPLNRMENHFRRLSGQEQFTDKMEDIIINKRI